LARLQPVRGTHDLFGDDARRHLYIADTARRIAGLYGFAPAATPIFVFTEVFQRTLGETSDIVTKEMYTFADKGGDNLTLRPEYTAGIARAIISGGLQNELPVKCFADGPMFRHERPQKGRLRQFHQIDVELVGVAEPVADVEVIALGAEILKALGVLGDAALELNTLGDTESRNAYRAVLVEYFRDHVGQLSDDSRDRLDRNPLRILDSKDPGDREIVAGAPSFAEHLTPAASDFFATVRQGLDDLDIAYAVNARLVRGLDYYAHTAFEFTTSALGAQGTILAGGRYDGLIEMMGGPAIPGVGWAAGIERLAMLVSDMPRPVRPIAVIGLGDTGDRAALKLSGELRAAGLTVELVYRGGLKRGLRRANRIDARFAVLLGDDELARRAATVRDLDSGVQQEVALTALKDHFTTHR
jgi:histidyl-tRNA synthetase